MNIEQLKGIGPKNQLIFNKMDIYTVEDLINYFPYKYLFICFKELKNLEDNESAFVKALILTPPKVYYIRRNFNYLSFMVKISEFEVNVKIFNRAFMQNNLKVGREIVLVGKYDKIKNSFLASDIRFNLENNKIEPKYHLVSGLKENFLVKAIDTILTSKINFNDYVPNEYNEKYNLISKKEALNYIHKPNNTEEIKKAKLKLIYEEFFNYTFKINALKLKNKKVLGIKRNIDQDKVDSFLSELPFKLTTDQLQTITEIIKDLNGEERMNRLVLGDVGSGKTIVAIVSILANYLSGYEAAFMAPTEILAKQHYETIKGYLNNLNIVLLTGHLKKKEKLQIYDQIKEGKIDLVIGTHALINDNVIFKKLGLVIIDEQHLFGVKQRNALQEKGEIKPDVLYLSATPIPRSYALCLYGDLDLSMIKTKPNKRKEVKTIIKTEKEIKDCLYKMLEEIKLGHQVFVVSPLINDEEEKNEINSVVKLKEKLELAFQNKIEIAIIHGKMKQNEKDQIMEDFLNKKIKILISTTVIEVGIDIPNATMMVIFNAERFGLAALHQLRGRVGRNDLQSYCYLISNQDNKRLKVMEESNDGFYISEKDFEQRGQGDLFGVRQSGDIIFKIASIQNDSKILLQASKDSMDYLVNHKYKNNSYYEKILEEINFLD